MSIQNLIGALYATSGVMSQISVESTDPSTSHQLLLLASAMKDLAVTISAGQFYLPEAALPACLKELGDASTAANNAIGKTDAERATAVVEGYEAVTTISSSGYSAGASANSLAAGAATANARFAGFGANAFKPVPDFPTPPIPPWWPRPKPFPWPFPRPWPFPPSPWPPTPWDWDSSNGWT